MVFTLNDIVLRRTGIATIGSPGETILRRVAETVAPDLGWDEHPDSTRGGARPIAFLKIPED